MIYYPDNIISEGMNKGYTLKEIFYYSPSYIEWLIKFVDDFEIDVDEFEALETVKIDYGLPKEASLLEEIYAELKIENHIYSSVQKIKESGLKFKVYSYTIPKDLLKILKEKKEGNYIAPQWTKAVPKKFRSYKELMAEKTQK